MTCLIKLCRPLGGLGKYRAVDVSLQQCKCGTKFLYYVNVTHQRFSSKTTTNFEYSVDDRNRISKRSFDVRNKAVSFKPCPDGALEGKVKETTGEVITIDNDPHTFGNLSKNKAIEKHEVDEGDLLEDKHLENLPSAQSKLRTKQYADMIKHFIKEKKISEAFDVLETRMIKQDRVKPETYIYSLLISTCGRLGYTKKAFQLYNQMKKRGLKVNGATYTGLFNACANSPWPEDGLKRATHLRKLVSEKGIELNSTHYHAMIKAFGRCGDLPTAFTLVDEMVDCQHKLTDETFNFLFHACITDKEAGFRHALLVWHKMLQKGISPSLYTYNLMLRSVRDCGLGGTDVAQNVVTQICGGESNAVPLADDDNCMQESDTDVSKQFQLEVCSETSNSSQTVNVSQPTLPSTENRPNLLAAQPYLGSIISLADVTKPHERLLLVGGSLGVLQQMNSTGVKPDIKTFTLMLDSIPPSISSENALLSAMKKIEVYPDIDFFNMLIKKRSMRFNYSSARDVLLMIQRAKLYPDIVTFGVLALGCTTKEEAKQLLWDMDNAGYRMNAEILGAMLQQACAQHNFDYIMEILYTAKDEEVRPNAQFLQHLKNLNASCWQLLKNKDKGLEVPNFVQNESFKKEYKTFSFRYRAWLREVKPEEDVHPWEQFSKPPPQDDMKNVKVQNKRNYS